jgi:hypothetical protein
MLRFNVRYFAVKGVVIKAPAMKLPRWIFTHIKACHHVLRHVQQKSAELGLLGFLWRKHVLLRQILFFQPVINNQD